MLISFGGFHDKSSCGYCHTSDGSRIFAFSALEMSVSQYRQLIDLGFRRSGTFCYKPDLSVSCCPQYTIRLDCSGFKPSKEHRQLLNRLLREVNPSATNKKHKGKENTFDLCHVVSSLTSDQSRLRVSLDTNKISEEKFNLYKKYQMVVHNDAEADVTHKSFKRFLCVDPFPRDYTEIEDGNGAFHQLYYLDGKLLAIGVIDLLPDTVSSVYFIWDPDYAHLGLGKIGALFEIALARNTNRSFYYMGYYIHNCVKMRYKGKYHPSYILDPQFSLISPHDPWTPLETFTKHLSESTKYYTRVQTIPPDQPIPGAFSSKPVSVRLMFKLRQGIGGKPDMMVPISLDQLTGEGIDLIVPYIEELNAVLGPNLASHTQVLINGS